jgi:hypothetical protein
MALRILTWQLNCALYVSHVHQLYINHIAYFILQEHYNHIYEGRKNLFAEVISEEDEDLDESGPDDNDNQDQDFKAFMWSEAPAAFEVEEQLPVDQVNYSWHLIS